MQIKKKITPRRRQLRNSEHFIEVPLTCSKNPAIVPYERSRMNPVSTLRSFVFKVHLTLQATNCE
jgi:hypothetical protein